jgi:hypothetical protein
MVEEGHGRGRRREPERRLISAFIEAALPLLNACKHARNAEISWKSRGDEGKRKAMQRGTAEIFLGLGLILIGILALKLTDHNYWWALIALGAAVGSKGGISVSQRARV